MAPSASLTGADVDGFYGALSRLLRTYQFRDRDRQTICGITATQCYALDFLVEAGRLTIVDLSRRLALNKSNGSRVVESLEAIGAVSRARDSADHRVRWIEPTAHGRELHARITGGLKRDYARLLAPFGPGFVRQMTGVLQTLAGRACQPAGAGAAPVKVRGAATRPAHPVRRRRPVVRRHT